MALSIKFMFSNPPSKHPGELYFQGSPFWRLMNYDRLDSSVYEIRVERKSFKFTKESLLFLSLKAFNHFKKQTFPFLIFAYQNDRNLKFDKHMLVQSFSELYSLFIDNILVEINEANVDAFIFLAEMPDNFSLLSVCNMVKLKKQTEKLSFYSQ
jgi:hypothetical protein